MAVDIPVGYNARLLLISRRIPYLLSLITNLAADTLDGDGISRVEYIDD